MAEVKLSSASSKRRMGSIGDASPATPERIAEAQRFVDAAGGSGSTLLLEALRKAFSLPGDEARSRTLAIITDGFVDIERQSYDLVRQNLGRGNVFAFGIGSSVNRRGARVTASGAMNSTSPRRQNPA